jgi:hypothetical protein
MDHEKEQPMNPKRGDLSLLDHPVARELLQARMPARLAYLAVDGTPRLVPMQFHWTGDEIVLSCFPDDPKAAALRKYPDVAISIDTAEPPFKVLQVRGTAAVATVDTLPPEAVAAAIRTMGPEGGQAFAERAARLSPTYVRIAVRPTWVDVLDFETRLPAGMERQLAARRA